MNKQMTSKMNHHHTKLLRKYFKANGDQMTEKSQANFILDFNQIILTTMENFPNQYIFTKPTKLLINKIDNSDVVNTYDKISYFKILIKLLRFINKPSKEVISTLRKYYTEVIRYDIDDTKLNESLYDFCSLIELLKILDGSDYILLYILINLSLPNQDVKIFYTNNLIKINDVISGISRDNIIFINDKKEIVYVRSFYKDMSNLITESYILHDSKMLNILLEHQNNTYISVNTKNFKYNRLDSHLKSIGDKYINSSNLSKDVIYRIMSDIKVN